MFKTNLKIAIRNFKKQKAYTFINIFGLSIGLGCFVLILLWVQHERSYDTFHKNFDNIYRVNKIWRKGEIAHYATTPAPLSDALKKEYPEIINSTRLLNIGQALLTYENKLFRESSGFVADTNFFKIFTFPFIIGDPDMALSTPHSVIITENLCHKLFGSEEPIGKRITVNGQPNITVAGVIKEIPENSHLKFSFLFSYSSLNERMRSDWHNTMYYTYILLNKKTKYQTLSEKISDYLKKPIADSTSSLYLQPLKKIHLYSANLRLPLSTDGNIMYVIIFILLAIFILIIASINFVNLTTAQSASRAKEVGLRKVFGAQRITLIKQFLGESVLLTFFALFLAIAFVDLFLPTFSNLVGINLSMNLTANFFLVIYLLSITLFTGIVSGIYPALFLSSFQPVKVLKETNKIGAKTFNFRKGLVVFQFFITVTLIIGTAVVYKQLHYIQNRNLGFDKEHLISIPTSQAIRENYESFKTELKQHPAILSITGSRSLPTWGHDIATEGISWPGKEPDEYLLMRGVGIDYGYIETFNIGIVAGRSFSKYYSTDTSNFIINETAAKAMKLDSPVGCQLTLWDKTGTIVGVVRDYHFKSLHNPIEPLLLRLYEPQWLSYLFIRVKPENISNTVRFLENKWKKFSQNDPFQFDFIDQLLENQYASDQRINRIIRYFSIISIIIACLGLFGLASYVTVQRTKEIGIRKVLGASASGIALLLSKEFAILVGISNLIALPAGYFIMNKWLQNFAYKTNLNIFIFLLSGLVTLTIALLTVSYQTFRVATTNPVESLRYE